MSTPERAVSDGNPDLYVSPERERISLPDGALIIIDGPAGSGKSTLARELGLRYGLPVAEGGTFNRVAGVIALEQGADLTKAEESRDVVQQLDFELSVGPDGLQRIIRDGRDITELCRSPEVTEICSYVSTHPESQKILYAQFRKIAERGDVIMTGRSLGRSLLPDAPAKLFLTGSVGLRAERTGKDPAVLHRRDMIDGYREYMPMRRPIDGLTIVNREESSLQSIIGQAAEYVEACYLIQVPD